MLVVSRDMDGACRVFRGDLALRLLQAVPDVDLKGRALVKISGKGVRFLHLMSSQGNHWCVAREEWVRDELAISAFYSIVDGRTKPKEPDVPTS